MLNFEKITTGKSKEQRIYQGNKSDKRNKPQRGRNR